MKVPSITEEHDRRLGPGKQILPFQLADRIGGMAVAGLLVIFRLDIEFRPLIDIETNLAAKSHRGEFTQPHIGGRVGR